MPEIKSKARPGVIGAVACFLLTVSFFIGFSDLVVLNTIIKITAIILSVQLIRSTSALYSCYVFRIPSLIILIVMPLFSLLLILMSFFTGTKAEVVSGIVNFFANTFAGTVVVVAFSLPLFILYYFIYLVRKFRKDGIIKVMTVIIAVFCGIYSVMRLDDKGIIPMMGRMGMAVSDMHIKVMSHSNDVALCVYLLGLAGFVILQYLISKENKIYN